MRCLCTVAFVVNCFISCTPSGTWTQNGPALGGRLSSIVASPTTPDSLLIASPGGGIWLTGNNGASWVMPRNYALADFTVLHLEWDKIRPGRLYACTQSDLYASTDMANTWMNLTGSGGYPARLMPADHYTDPNPFAQLRFAGGGSVIIWSKPGYGLYYSFDGNSFTQYFPFPGGSSNPDNFISAIGADESTGKIYFSTMRFEASEPGRLYRSTCAWADGAPCLTWELANNGLEERSFVTSIVYGGSANRMAILLRKVSEPYGAVMTTTDGINWNPTATMGTYNWDPRPLVTTAPNQLLAGTVAAYLSNDWGASWNELTAPNQHPDMRSFYSASYPAAGNYLWSTTDGSASSGTYGNINRWNLVPGSTPTAPLKINTNGTKTWQAFFMAVSTQAGISRKRLFIGAIDNGLVGSDDGGTTWVSTGTPGGCLDNISMQFAPNNPNRGYAVTCDGSVLAKTDNALSAATVAAVSWSSVTVPGGAGPSAMWNNASIAIDPGNADRVCIVRSYDITVSNNGGTNWTSSHLPGNANPVSAYIDADHALYITTLDSGIYKTTDDGATWQPFGLNDGSFPVISKIIHTAAGGAGGTFFAATSKGLYRKLPGGNFEYVNSGGDASYVVSDIEADPTCPSRIYICKGYLGGYISHRGGVLVSHDNGNSFTSLTSGLNLHQGPVSDIMVDPVDPRRLYVASYGQGGWTYTWSSLPACE